LGLAYPTTRGPIRYGGDRRKILLPLVLVAGAFIGTLSGLVGVGGGVLLVPLMVLGLALETKRAVSTSLAVVLCTAIVGAAGYIATGFREELLSLPPLIVGSMLGAWFGVRLREIARSRSSDTRSRSTWFSQPCLPWSMWFHSAAPGASMLRGTLRTDAGVRSHPSPQTRRLVLREFARGMSRRYDDSREHRRSPV
jgi:sulfite exporter TauE/SafE